MISPAVINSLKSLAVYYFMLFIINLTSNLYNIESLSNSPHSWYNSVWKIVKCARQRKRWNASKIPTSELVHAHLIPHFNSSERKERKDLKKRKERKTPFVSPLHILLKVPHDLRSIHSPCSTILWQISKPNFNYKKSINWY